MEEAKTISSGPADHDQGRNDRLIEGDDFQRILARQTEFFNEQRTKTLEFRRGQLHKLGEGLRYFERKILTALHQDLRKNPVEAYAAELGIVLTELSETIKHLKKWMRPQRVPTPMVLWPARCQIIPEPVGRTLIISPWNYPLQLSLVPLLGSIAAGNVVVLKPSELAPHTADVLAELIAHVFQPELCSVIKGGVGVSKTLLKESWGHVFFTGSTAVGRQVAQAAAETLSPVTLELGGKSPCLISKTANLQVAARRVVFGKFFNAGQTCVAPDYLLVEEEVHDRFVNLLKEEIERRLGKNPLENSQLPKIINKNHYDRLKRLIVPEKVVFGGRGNDKELLLEPTLMTRVSIEDPIMKDEIFGPLLPILSVKNLHEAKSIIHRFDKPLALYIFSESNLVEQDIIGTLSYGGGCINDTLMHLANPNLPFGGVGASGVGAYHGKHSFDCFSHKKSLLTNPTWIDLPFRYFPWTQFKDRLFRRLLR
jgi:aldehyde dehydrogenase (NAD+)